MLYVKTFLAVGVTMGVIVHYVTREAMPWWPDTAIMGATFGTMAATGMLQHHRTHRRFWYALTVTYQRWAARRRWRRLRRTLPSHVNKRG